MLTGPRTNPFWVRGLAGFTRQEQLHIIVLFSRADNNVLMDIHYPKEPGLCKH